MKSNAATHLYADPDPESRRSRLSRLASSPRNGLLVPWYALSDLVGHVKGTKKGEHGQIDDRRGGDGTGVVCQCRSPTLRSMMIHASLAVENSEWRIAAVSQKLL